MRKRFIISLITSMTTMTYAQIVDVEVNVNIKHTVGNVSTFDRSKFITIHASHTENDWNHGQRGARNFTDDLLADFILGNDVYFGRDTGYISWNLRNRIEEDPSKSGWARVSGSTYSISSQGANSRNSYKNKTWIHKYESRASSDIMAAQFDSFWPGTDPANGPSGRKWYFTSKRTRGEEFGTATGHYMGHFLNHFYGTAANHQVGRPLPAFVEVMNEPDWPLMDNGDTPASKVWKFHNAVAKEIRRVNSDVLIGGYCTTFPDLEENDFREWEEEWRLFIDLCGANMDFYTLHFYDFEDYTDRFRKGSNLEATLDMIEHYSHLKIGKALPFIISEYSGRARNLESKDWSAYHDWMKIKSMSAMLMSFMDRPNLMLKTIPFIVTKAEWGRNPSTGIPYSARLMRQANEPASYSGPWVYSDKVKFYQLWSDVKGTRIDTSSSDPDIQVDAYVNGKKAYLICNNLTKTTQNIKLNLIDDYQQTVDTVREKNMYWNGARVTLDKIQYAKPPAQIQLRSEGTAVLEYSFTSTVNIDKTSDEVKYYATTYFKPISAGTPHVFHINDVSLGSDGKAVLRLGMGRYKTRSKHPTVLINGNPIQVPTDFMGHEGDDRNRFFGELDIPVPYELLKTDNTVTVTYPDTGGYISSVALRVFTFDTAPEQSDPSARPRPR